jgi:hypothetical protein
MATAVCLSTGAISGSYFHFLLDGWKFRPL